MPRIYLDHNASTPLRPEVAELIAQRAREAQDVQGNPSSVHREGREARARLSAARKRLAEALKAEPHHVYFTASGTEANLWALRGAFLAGRERGRRRVVASSVEHPSVLQALEALERWDGAERVLVPPEPDGQVRAPRIFEALDASDAALCTLMWANNETGVLQPVEELGRGCAERGVPFHTDAVQAVGKVRVDLSSLLAPFVTLSGHKVGGPAGVGALVAKLPIVPLISGHQESGLRGGTPDVAACEALALAVQLAVEEQEAEASRLGQLRDGLERELRARFAQARINGMDAPRVPGTTNVMLSGADAETLLIALDLDGIAVSTGAACASGSLSPSHVLLAMGMTAAEARSTLRVSLGRTSSEDEVRAFLDALARQLG